MARKSRAKRARVSGGSSVATTEDVAMAEDDSGVMVMEVDSPKVGVESDEAKGGGGVETESLHGSDAKKGKLLCNHAVKGVAAAIKGLEKSRCTDCQSRARWLCLACRVPLCAKGNDHLSSHLKDHDHFIFVHLTSGRAMCMMCDTELTPEAEAERRNETMESEECEPSASNIVSIPAAKAAKKTSTVDTRGQPVESCALESRPIMTNVEDSDDDIRPKGLSGLNNLGNTCYANAALQALNNCPPFSDYFRRKCSLGAYAGSGQSPLVSHAFMQLVQKMWSPLREPTIYPDHLLYQIRNKCPQFSGYAQQDSQEFIRCLLELIHRELARPVYAHEDAAASAWRRKKETTGTVSSQPPQRYRRRSSGSGSAENAGDSGWSSDGDTTGVQVEEEINWKPIRQRSVVSDVFDGTMESAVRCLTCNNVSTVTETFADLSLQIATPPHNAPVTIDDDEEMTEDSWLSSWLRWFSTLSSWFIAPSVTLADCFSAFFTPDRLIGDDMYSCEKCNKLRNGVKSYRITRLPEVLCVHLKRFHHDQMAGGSKVNTRVSFPLHGLDLSGWSTEAAGESEYELCALVCHEGASADCGHYVAIARNEIDDNWYEFDDSTVTKLDAAYVLTKDAYILFYQKKQGVRQERIRETVRQMMSPTAIATSPLTSRHYISTEWLERLSTFAEPGSITNFDFLCPHGHLLPRRSEHVSVICTPIPTPLWRYLSQTFGGGPGVSQLHYCAVCEKRSRGLVEKRKREVDLFRRLEHSLKVQSEESEALLYSAHLPLSCISKSWYQLWEKFVMEPAAEPPGPMDNSHLLMKTPDGNLKHRPRANCLHVPREFFLFFHGIYGGGPEVFAMEGIQPRESEVTELTRLADVAIATERQRLQRMKLTGREDGKSESSDEEGEEDQ